MNSSAVSGPAIERNVPLSFLTTIRIGGPADSFAEPKTEKELLQLVRGAAQEGQATFILGNGSNVIFSDAGFNGLVISLRKFQNDLIEFDHEKLTVMASSGVSLSRLVRACQEEGFSGLEFLAHIPGTVGGALIMNAGFSRHPGQQNAIGDVVSEVRVIETDGSIRELGCDAICFRYRGSDLKGRIILGAKFRLWKRPAETIQNEIRANVEYRREKQDVREPNAGSIFKNPAAPAPSAGVLIEKAGLKGKRIGAIEVSQKHANYFINHGGGTCADLLALMKEVQKAVFDATGITLEPEVQIIPENEASAKN